MDRRKFLTALGAGAVGAALPASVNAAPAPGMRFGYAAITWGDALDDAVRDVEQAGFAGIQLRANAVDQWTAAQTREKLAAHKLAFVALSSGDLSLDAPAEEQMALHTRHAQYVKQAGGLYLQILDKLTVHPRTATAAECAQLGRMLNELGKRTADMGIPLGYHNHLNTLSELPENLDRILDQTDARYVKLELDVGHYAAMRGDPAAAIRRYHDRLLFVHLKDVVDAPAASRYPFQWVELGRGRVNFPAVMAALKEAGFAGWAVVELDRVPVAGRTPLESALISRDYLTHTLHQQL